MTRRNETPRLALVAALALGMLGGTGCQATSTPTTTPNASVDIWEGVDSADNTNQWMDQVDTKTARTSPRPVQVRPRSADALRANEFVSAGRYLEREADRLRANEFVSANQVIQRNSLPYGDQNACGALKIARMFGGSEGDLPRQCSGFQ